MLVYASPGGCGPGATDAVSVVFVVVVCFGLEPPDPPEPLEPPLFLRPPEPNERFLRIPIFESPLRAFIPYSERNQL